MTREKAFAILDELPICKEGCDTSFSCDECAEAFYMAMKALKQQEIIRCKDCKNQECEGRNGEIVCDLTGEQHKPDWFCADGELI